MTERNNNFVDPLTGQEFFINAYILVVDSEGKTAYKHKKNKQVITNPETGTVLEFIPLAHPDGFTTAYAAFNSLSREDKKKAMKKRSKDHAKGNRDFKRYLDTKHIKGQE